MSENDVVDSGIELPRMASVQPLPDYVLRVKWAEGPRAGRDDLVDVSPAVFSYKVYRPLRDERLFLTAAIAEDGDAVAWGGAEDLAMSADTIQSLAQESWTPREFVDFLTRNRTYPRICRCIARQKQKTSRKLRQDGAHSPRGYVSLLWI